jgi:RND family efflux transporter MFP subunit
MKKVIVYAMALPLVIACNPAEKKDTQSEKKEIRVTTVTVKKEKVVTALRYSGTIEAYQNIPLNFQTTGTVETVLADAGDMVTKGQLLATLGQADAKNMYEITLSQYQQAKDAYDRLKTVHEKGSLPDIKWVEMESKLEQASSSLDIAKNNLDKCRLYAPVNGMVGRRNIEPGMSSISIGSAPFELVDIRQVYVKISVPENEVARITRGIKSRFSVSALDDREFGGTVTNISPVADRISRTYEAKILVPNADLALKPGMVCDVTMEQTMQKEMILIPYQCVSKDSDNRTFVYLADPATKRARKQVIQTGQYQGEGVEVIAGLEPGQTVVNGGKEKLSENSLIAW